MAGKLYAVEGASGSGKDTLLKQIEEKGYVVMRGIPSQYQELNSQLTEEAQEVFNGKVIIFNEFLKGAVAEIENILGAYLEATNFQLDEALEQEAKGTLFLNRSIISALAHLNMTRDILKKEEFEKPYRKLKLRADEILKKFLEYVDGIILMKHPIPNVKESGISGLEEVESKHINQIISGLKNIPLLELDANEMSIEDEVKAFEKFIETPSLE